MESGDSTPGKSPHNQSGDRDDRQVSFEELVSDVTAELAAVPCDADDDGIERCLGMIARSYESDLAYLFLLSSDLSRLSITHLWRSGRLSAAQSERSPTRNLTIMNFPWMKGHLVPEEPSILGIGDMAQEGRVAGASDAGISEVVIPLRHSGTMQGSLRLWMVGTRITSTTVLFRQLELLASVLSPYMPAAHGPTRSRAAEATPDDVRVGARVGESGNRATGSQVSISESAFHLMSTQIGHVLYDWDLVTGRVAYSGAIQEVTGYHPNELAHVTVVERDRMIHPEDRHAVVEALGRATEHDGRYVEIYRLLRKDDTSAYVEDRGVVVRDSHGSPVRMLGALKDISVRFHTLAAIRASEEKYRSIFESFQDIFYRATIEGEITLVSPSVYTKLGYRPDEVVGHQATEFYADDPSVRKLLIERLLQQSQISDFELKMKTKDGRILDVSVSAHLLRDADGTVTGYEGVLRDISERKKADAILRSMVKGTAARIGRQFFRALVQSMSEALECKFVHVGELVGSGNRVRTLAYWNNGKFDRNFEYELDRPDCRLVKHRSMCVHARGFANSAPHHPCAPQFGVQSLVGAPLIGAQDGLLGFMMVMDDQPIPASLLEQTQSLITIAAARASAELERLRADQELRRTVTELQSATEKLRHEQVTLTEKNIALKTILEHIEQEREGYRAEVCADLDQALAPYLKKLKHGNGRLSSRDLTALTEIVGTIVGQGVDSFKSNYSKLSPRETEICELIIDGHPSKYISEILGISIETIHKHREIIRRKLRIQHLDINLSTYLRSKLR